MAAREFTAYVVLRDPDTLQPLSFAPGDEVPEWANVGDHVASNGVTRTRQSAEEANTGDDTGASTEGATETVVTPEYEQTDDTDETDEVPPYEEWSKTDLKAEAKGRELSGYSNATVDELVAMLQADDADNEE